MTLLIRDLGDEWQYGDYSVTRDYQLGISVELSEPVTAIPWLYARTVEVEIDNDHLEFAFTGHVDRSATSYSVDDGHYETVVVSEAPRF